MADRAAPQTAPPTGQPSAEQPVEAAPTNGTTAAEAKRPVLPPMPAPKPSRGARKATPSDPPANGTRAAEPTISPGWLPSSAILLRPRSIRWLVAALAASTLLIVTWSLPWSKTRSPRTTSG